MAKSQICMIKKKRYGNFIQATHRKNKFYQVDYEVNKNRFSSGWNERVENCTTSDSITFVLQRIRYCCGTLFNQSPQSCTELLWNETTANPLRAKKIHLPVLQPLVWVLAQLLYSWTVLPSCPVDCYLSISLTSNWTTEVIIPEKPVEPTKWNLPSFALLHMQPYPSSPLQPMQCWFLT